MDNTKNSIRKLIELFKENNVEYEVHSILGISAVTWTGKVCRWIALPDVENETRDLAVAVYKDYLTPEQIIETTL